MIPPHQPPRYFCCTQARPATHVGRSPKSIYNKVKQKRRSIGFDLETRSAKSAVQAPAIFETNQ